MLCGFDYTNWSNFGSASSVHVGKCDTMLMQAILNKVLVSKISDMKFIAMEGQQILLVFSESESPDNK